MKTEKEIREYLQESIYDYTYLKVNGDLTSTKRIKLETTEKVLKWVLEDKDA